MIFNGDRSKIEPYLRQLADLMGLKDWFVRLMDDAPDDETSFATIQAWTDLRLADIRITNEWADADPETFRRYMVHELIHAHLQSMEQPLRHIRAGIGDTIFNLAYAFYRDAEETAVDSMAVAWAKTLPLPVDAKKKRKEGKAG